MAAEVVFPSGHSHSGSLSSTAGMVSRRAPRIDMVPNPDFSFPMQPQPSSALSTRPNSAHDSTGSSQTMFAHLPDSHESAVSHRRAVSTLPSFSFNSADASGLKERSDSPDSPQMQDEVMAAPVTPSRRGHRRGGSEFVGGDSRLGMDNAVSSSPTKAAAGFPVPANPAGPPAGRRGHAHRRSTAMSSHDVSNMMQPAEVQPRLSNSLPNTPLEFPALSERNAVSAFTSTDSTSDISDPFGPPLDTADERPPSSRRVGFSDNVTIIPRPLSTISSETESSISTVRGHSVNNSISSVLSLSTPSPPATRAMRSSLSTTLEDEDKPKTKSSLEISRRVEKEGEWLKSRSSSSLRRPLSESAVATLSTVTSAETATTTSTTPTTTFALPDTPVRSKGPHRKKQSFTYGLSFDRRKSEPTFGSAGETSRLSATSLHESTNSRNAHDSQAFERLSSTRRIKNWAASMIPRRQKGQNKDLVSRSSTSSIRPESLESEAAAVPGKVSMEEQQPPIAETNLDAVFGSSSSGPSLSDFQWSRMPPPAPLNLVATNSSYSTSSHGADAENDDSGVMVDLDAALGPLQTPPLGSGSRQRRELHSSRGTRDFNGPGGHYHRRAESAPALAPFESQMSAPQPPSMADVFEEEEEEDEEEMSAPAFSKASSVQSIPEEEDTGIGIEIVDEDRPTSANPSSHPGALDETVGPRGEWEPERHLMGYSAGLRLSNVTMERRASSLIEETIAEEPSSPQEDIEIVEAHEEPRTSSLTKSSDSSEAATLMGQPTDMLMPSTGTDSMATTPDVFLTPETYQTSTFSSPDFNRRQEGSFETSRLGTSASSIADNRTISSCCTTSDNQNHCHHRISVDDVPSLTSSRSTMLSSMHADSSSRRDFSGSSDRTPSASSTHILHDNNNNTINSNSNNYSNGSSKRRLLSANSTSDANPNAAATRRKRSSIQSLSQLVGGPFGSKLKLVDSDAAAASAGGNGRPQTAIDGAAGAGGGSRRSVSRGFLAAPRRKEHRLKKLMFWKSKHGSVSGNENENGVGVGVDDGSAHADHADKLETDGS